MLSVEIRAGADAQIVPLAGKLVLGAAHGLAEGALELEPRPDGAVAICRADNAKIGNQKLPMNARRLLRPGESIALGAAQVSVVAEPEGDAPHTRMLARAMLKGTPPSARPSMPSLVWLNGPDLGRRALVVEEATFIGRGDGCVARVNDAQASRMHAKIVRAPEGLKLVDLMSANGVLVDGERVLESRLLRGGETIQIGHTLLGFELPREVRKAPPPPPKPIEKPVEKAPEPPKVVVAPEKPEPVEPPKAAKPKKPAVTRFELALLGFALFALGAGGAVIAWAVR